MLNVSEAARYLNHTRPYIRKLANQGMIQPTFTPEGRMMFEESSLEDYINRTLRAPDLGNWGFWFSGLVDGEGHFAIQRHHHGGSITPDFSIGLRIEEEPIIRDIQQHLQCGSVYLTPRTYINKYGEPIAKKVVFYTHSLDDARKLVDVFSIYPLRTNKRQDFELWAELVSLKIIRRGSRDQKIRDRMEFLFHEIRRVRIDRKIH